MLLSKQFLLHDPIRHAGILEVLRRGTAIIKEDDNDGIMVMDSISRITYIACKDTDKACSWYQSHCPIKDLLCIYDENLKDRIMAEGTMEIMMECDQYAYVSDDLPPLSSSLCVRAADQSDVPFILSIYDHLEEWEIRMIIDDHHLWIGEENGKPVGMIGMHLEGSMGLLVILPEYRRCGYALTMESFLIHTIRKLGQICFTQVVKDNDASHYLQKKLGLKKDTCLQYWLVHQS